MTQLRLFTSLGLALVVGCSPTNLSPPPPASDAGAQADAFDAGPAPTDTGTPPTDVPAIVCVSDRDCSSDGLVCALDQGRCVQCNAAMDCASGQVCLRNACVTTVACTTSRMCPGQVCSQRLGYCVDCEADNDCPTSDRCVASTCVPRPTTCTTDSQCSPMGRVCDRATGVCVACNVDTDCGASGWCGGDHTCRARACTPGTMMCADATRQSVCDPRGAGYTVTTCASGESCREGRCQPTACTPGAASCDPTTGARRVCAADGSGFTTSPCPSGQTCSMGMCVATVCTPGSAVCASATERSVCNPDGLSATRSACPAVMNADATCAAGACGFTCRSGFGDCDGMAANGCEANFATSAAHCGACGRACGAGQTCVAGACRAEAATRYVRVDSPADAEFVDACAALGSQRVLTSSADGSQRIGLPFTFQYWSRYLPAGSLVNVNVNGWLNLLGGTETSQAGSIPSTTAPNGLVAAFFRNLSANPMGICIATVGSSPARRWVVEWPEARSADSSLGLTFEVVLHEQSRAIDIVFGAFTGDLRGARAPIGLESPDGRDAVSGCDGPPPYVCEPTAGMKVRFVPAP